VVPRQRGGDGARPSRPGQYGGGSSSSAGAGAAAPDCAYRSAVPRQRRNADASLGAPATRVGPPRWRLAVLLTAATAATIVANS